MLLILVSDLHLTDEGLLQEYEAAKQKMSKSYNIIRAEEGKVE